MDIQIYDTTLRDGTQREGLSLSSIDKMRIARKLDDLGVAFIEGGWPGSNPKDVEFFEKAQETTWNNALICAFGSTRRAGTTPEKDANIMALLQAKTPVCTLVGKSWTLHVTDVLRTTLDENLRMIEEFDRLSHFRRSPRNLRCGAFLRWLPCRSGLCAGDSEGSQPRRSGNAGALRYQWRQHAARDRNDCAGCQGTDRYTARDPHTQRQ